MPFSFTNYEKYKESVRSLCAGADEVDIPDGVMTPGTIHYDTVVVKVNTKVTYDDMTDTQKDAVNLAAVRLLAARLCRTHCKGLYKSASDDQHLYAKQKIDWDALARTLEGEADEILSETVSAPNTAALIPLWRSPAYGYRQHIKQYNNDTGEIDLL